jgi:hypothetical protein
MDEQGLIKFIKENVTIETSTTSSSFGSNGYITISLCIDGESFSSATIDVPSDPMIQT